MISERTRRTDKSSRVFSGFDLMAITQEIKVTMGAEGSLLSNSTSLSFSQRHTHYRQREGGMKADVCLPR